MADAREEHVWTEHALKDHVNIEPYKECKAIDNLLKIMEITPKIVVDMGCGSGLWRPIFKDMNYIGVDQNEAMISVASRHYPRAMIYQVPNVPGVASDIQFFRSTKDTFFIRYNLRDNMESLFEIQYSSFSKLLDIDLIWFSAVLQHNRESDKDEIMSNVRKLLQPGKYLMFTETVFTPSNLPPQYLTFKEGMTDGWSYTRLGWNKYISKFGFELIVNDPFNYFLFRRIE